MSLDLRLVRNIGIAAHIDAGKTTTTERILYYTDRVNRMGDVDDGTTTTDFDEQEQKRGITIWSAAVTCPWKGYTINLIDTPGHVDFTAEVERSLRVLDGAVVVFDAKEGVEAQSETVWRQAQKYHVPRLCFLNKMDKVGADFFASFRSIVERLESHPVAVQLPIGADATFEGIIDLLRMKAVYYDPATQGATFRETEIPAESLDEAKRWRHILEEKVAEFDDGLMEKYIHEQPLTAEEMKPAIRKGVIANKLHPVLCGSSLRNTGVQAVLDAVCDYLPSPLDLPPVAAHDPEKPDKTTALKADPAGPLAALVFKVVADKPVDLYFVRVYSGKLKSNARVWNPATKTKENISRIFRVFAKRREPITELEAGDIGAVVGPKSALTSHTLCDQHKPLLLESIIFPETVISQSIEPLSSRDRDKLAESLAALSRQDPTFKANMNPETGQTLISGMGELHLEVLVTRLTKEMNVEVRIGKPRVSFRETVTGVAEAEGRFIKQTGGRGHFAVVKLRVGPLPRHRVEPGATGGSPRRLFDLPASAGGVGTVARADKLPVAPMSTTRDTDWFISNLPGGKIQPQFVAAVKQGVQDAATSGSLGGYPMMDYKVTLLDGQEHDVDSSELAFEQAARMAFEQAVAQADPVLLEPIMKVEVVTPDDYFGSIVGDLNSRRANVTNSTLRGNMRVIDAEVPLREMFGYTTDLRSLSQGRATATMEPLSYAPVPANVAKQMLGS